jgi:hypothetical protein
MTKPEKMEIRNVIATRVGKTNFGLVCQPAEYGSLYSRRSSSCQQKTTRL